MISGRQIAPRAALVCVGVVVLLGLVLQNAIYEDIALRIAPSAKRAYGYGNRFFNASSKNYDLQKAQRFYLAAEKIDPEYPYLQHQLARIAFLEGNFDDALRRINKEIDRYGESHANSFYVRGLIHGFRGDYDSAAKDYETYLGSDPTNWAAINDYAWVLLKAGHPRDALVALDWGLIYWPDNPWLLNSKAIALFERGEFEKAKAAALHAGAAVIRITEADWMRAYPGNDPLIAQQGVLSFKNAVLENIHTLTSERQRR